MNWDFSRTKCQKQDEETGSETMSSSFVKFIPTKCNVMGDFNSGCVLDTSLQIRFGIGTKNSPHVNVILAAP